MVTWGANTTHTFTATATPAAPAFGSTPAPAPPSLFGSSPAPAPSSGFFGSTPAPSFGSPAPAPSGGIFGSSPAPAPSGGFFGSSPAPSGSIFGSSPAPSSGLFGTPSTSSLFGTPAPAPSMFGSTNTSFFGAPAPGTAGQPQQQQQQIPAQAAIQAHMDASARQEAERVRSALERLNAAYAGMPLPNGGGEEESKFVAIVYNPITPEQRQLQWMHGMGNGGTILEPARPPQVSEKQWKKAVVENPDPQSYVPQAMVGAVALQARISWQQERANQMSSQFAVLQKSQDMIQERSTLALQEVEAKVRKHAALRKRLLDVMRKVELARCMNQPMQPDEVKALQRLAALNKEVESVRGVLISLQDKARTQATAVAKNISVSGAPDTKQLLPVLQDHRQKLQKMTAVAEKDQRDVSLIHKRVAGTFHSVPRL